MMQTLLIVDDEESLRLTLRLRLKDQGFNVLVAEDGETALELLKTNKVDLILLDINMPKMDGYGVIRHIRAQSEHKTTPILVLTTESETDKRNLARDAGATGWMVKPFDPAALIATINKVSP